MKKSMNIMTLLLLISSALICVGLYQQKNMWFVICIYWTISVIRNLVDYLDKKKNKTKNNNTQITLNETACFDEEEIIPDCTVQILRNTTTGEESIGWWRNSHKPTNLTNNQTD